MSSSLKLVLTAVLVGFILSRATRTLKDHGYHNALATLFDKRMELLGWIFMSFLSAKMCAESTPTLAFIVSFIALIGCGILLDGLLFTPQKPLSSPSKCLHSDDPMKVPPEAHFLTADAAECREIIKSGTPPTASKNTLSALEARARPNQRLKLAYDIESCFTSSDGLSCKNFRAQVEKLLYVEEREWVNFAVTARAIADEALDVSEDTTSLFRVVQLLTLKTMITVLWPDRDPKQSTNEQISTLAHEVNLQWLRSKETDADVNPSWLFDKQISLKDAVKAVFPDWDEADSEQSPCNLILPGYETMWRVVLRCFVELRGRGHHRSDSWTFAMLYFLRNPTKQQLEAPTPHCSTKVAAVHVVKEALRLYPPTRRIYREHRSDNGQKTNVAADIEAMQRDPTIWQSKPDVFSPERWIGVEAGYDIGYMPFGASPFNCPAKRHKNVAMPFGPSMIALLVGALYEATMFKWHIRGAFPKRDRPLDTDREAYSTAILRR
jgi:hypothetical protein